MTPREFRDLLELRGLVHAPAVRISGKNLREKILRLRRSASGGVQRGELACATLPDDLWVWRDVERALDRSDPLCQVRVVQLPLAQPTEEEDLIAVYGGREAIPRSHRVPVVLGQLCGQLRHGKATPPKDVFVLHKPINNRGAVWLDCSDRRNEVYYVRQGRGWDVNARFHLVEEVGVGIPAVVLTSMPGRPIQPGDPLVVADDHLWFAQGTGGSSDLAEHIPTHITQHMPLAPHIGGTPAPDNVIKSSLCVREDAAVTEAVCGDGDGEGESAEPSPAVDQLMGDPTLYKDEGSKPTAELVGVSASVTVPSSEEPTRDDHRDGGGGGANSPLTEDGPASDRCSDSPDDNRLMDQYIQEIGAVALCQENDPPKEEAGSSSSGLFATTAAIDESFRRGDGVFVFRGATPTPTPTTTASTTPTSAPKMVEGPFGPRPAREQPVDVGNPRSSRYLKTDATFQRHSLQPSSCLVCWDDSNNVPFARVDLPDGYGVWDCDIFRDGRVGERRGYVTTVRLLVHLASLEAIYPSDTLIVRREKLLKASYHVRNNKLTSPVKVTESYFTLAATTATRRISSGTINDNAPYVPFSDWANVWTCASPAADSFYPATVAEDPSGPLPQPVCVPLVAEGLSALALNDGGAELPADGDTPGLLPIPKDHPIATAPIRARTPPQCTCWPSSLQPSLFKTDPEHPLPPVKRHFTMYTLSFTLASPHPKDMWLRANTRLPLAVMLPWAIKDTPEGVEGLVKVPAYCPWNNAGMCVEVREQRQGRIELTMDQMKALHDWLIRMSEMIDMRTFSDWSKWVPGDMTGNIPRDALLPPCVFVAPLVANQDTHSPDQPDHHHLDHTLPAIDWELVHASLHYIHTYPPGEKVSLVASRAHLEHMTGRRERPPYATDHPAVDRVMAALRSRGEQPVLISLMSDDETRQYRWLTLTDVMWDTASSEVQVEAEAQGEGEGEGETMTISLRDHLLKHDICTDVECPLDGANFVVHANFLRGGGRNILAEELRIPDMSVRLADTLHPPESMLIMPISPQVFECLTWVAGILFHMETHARCIEVHSKLLRDMNNHLEDRCPAAAAAPPVKLRFDLLQEALTAPSTHSRAGGDAAGGDGGDDQQWGVSSDYQRLEWFGDIVLKFAAAYGAFHRLDGTGRNGTQKEMTVLASQIKTNEHLKARTDAIGLGSALVSQPFHKRRPLEESRLCKGKAVAQRSQVLEEQSWRKHKTTADVMESVLGAVYLSNVPDGEREGSTCVDTHRGLLAAFTFIDAFISPGSAFPCLLDMFPEARVAVLKHCQPEQPIEQLWGWTFRRKGLLHRAGNEHSCVQIGVSETNETLEFLGDAVMELCMAHYLFFRKTLPMPLNTPTPAPTDTDTDLQQQQQQAFINQPTGALPDEKQLTAVKQALVNNDTLSRKFLDRIIEAKRSVGGVSIGDVLRVGDEHQRAILDDCQNRYQRLGWEGVKSHSSARKTVADFYEALVGATYLDCFSLEEVWRVIQKDLTVESLPIEDPPEEGEDAKEPSAPVAKKAPTPSAISSNTNTAARPTATANVTTAAAIASSPTAAAEGGAAAAPAPGLSAGAGPFLPAYAFHTDLPEGAFSYASPSLLFRPHRGPQMLLGYRQEVVVVRSENKGDQPFAPYFRVWDYDHYKKDNLDDPNAYLGTWRLLLNLTDLEKAPLLPTDTLRERRKKLAAASYYVLTGSRSVPHPCVDLANLNTEGPSVGPYIPFHLWDASGETADEYYASYLASPMPHLPCPIDRDPTLLSRYVNDPIFAKQADGRGIDEKAAEQRVFACPEKMVSLKRQVVRGGGAGGGGGGGSAAEQQQLSMVNSADLAIVSRRHVYPFTESFPAAPFDVVCSPPGSPREGGDVGRFQLHEGGGVCVDGFWWMDRRGMCGIKGGEEDD
ncbi:unnamed protein product [Vitrella brassicaformis CCMP3155]|uniref:RNase III domain-containing protein n=4 Tax=Vitrella brassicaformis TaxID=1169539 RepID=A0A0G4FNU5_VITBC|nr:unnamed protein product [Vitrella brassicaformis CCMP3155]|eukprot:CEM15899.1 unnamed protein product [Vitrella brassicaformis CCMP3155]